MTREALLKASVTEFEDNVKNAYVYSCKRYITKSGYSYIIKDVSSQKQISCAIHWNASFLTDEKIGKRESNEVSLNTREKIEFGSLIEYNGLTISITSQDDYNATMGQWHYHGIAALPINKHFLVTTEEEINEHLGVNSMSLFMVLDLGFPIVPSFYSANNTNKFIMVDIQESAGITPVYRRGNEVIQYKQDRLRMSFINLTTIEAMECLEKLENYTLDSKHSGFAINDIMSLRDDNIYQKSFDWKSVTYTSEFNVNYYLKAYSEHEQKIIRQAFFKSIIAI